MVFGIFHCFITILLTLLIVTASGLATAFPLFRYSLSFFFFSLVGLTFHSEPFFRNVNPNGIYVFEPNGEIMTTDSFNRRLKKYCKEAGVSYHSSHKIRFYNASTAFDGNNLTTLSYLMGHSETATTLHYLRNVNKRKNDRLVFQNLGISS